MQSLAPPFSVWSMILGPAETLDLFNWLVPSDWCEKPFPFSLLWSLLFRGMERRNIGCDGDCNELFSGVH